MFWRKRKPLFWTTQITLNNGEVVDCLCCDQSISAKDLAAMEAHFKNLYSEYDIMPAIC